MIWYYGNEKPRPVESKLRLGQRQRTVNFNVRELTEGPYKYGWQSVTLEPGVWNYGPIVSAIINLEYPADKMQAVVNNYLADQDDPEAAGEMLDMQQWRALAKKVAKDVLALEGGV